MLNNEEWRKSLKGLFESATANTFMEMPETDDAIVDAPVDEVPPMDGMDTASETITVSKEFLAALLRSVAGSHEDMEDEMGDDLEGELDGELDDVDGEVVDDIVDVEEPIEEVADEVPPMEEPVANLEAPVDAGLDDGIEDEVAGEFDDELDGEEIEPPDLDVDSIVDEIFAKAALGDLTPESVPEIVAAGSAIEDAGDLDVDDMSGLDDEPVDDIVADEPIAEPLAESKKTIKKSRK